MSTTSVNPERRMRGCAVCSGDVSCLIGLRFLCWTCAKREVMGDSRANHLAPLNKQHAEARE